MNPVLDKKATKKSVDRLLSETIFRPGVPQGAAIGVGTVVFIKAAGWQRQRRIEKKLDRILAQQ